MRAIRNLWRKLFEIRPGEHGRFFSMFFYLFFVLFAYYILRVVSDSLFVSSFDIDDLPYLYILIAAVGGAAAYLYTRVLVQASLVRAVDWAMGIAAVCLLLFWWQIPFHVAVSGKVTDAGGAAIADAQVQARDLESGQTHSTQTDVQGEFAFPKLESGKYELIVEKAGFQRLRIASLKPEAAKKTRVELRLQPGTPAQTVFGKVKPTFLPSDDGGKGAWMIYVLSVWVKLFSIVLVSQGWLVASNVFTSREAKRLYGLLGAGAVLGAFFGGTFTKHTVLYTGTRHQLLASALTVVLAYLAFRITTMQRGVTLAAARAASREEVEKFSFSDILSSIRRYHHLQVIIGIITITYFVDVVIDFQFKAWAKRAHPGVDELTAFFGTFYGTYLNAVTIVLQLFLTTAVVRRIGVGGTLMVSPGTIATMSSLSFLLPGIGTATAAKLGDSASRYTLNRIAMELLYLPLPLELRNRTKAFVDIFVDRMGRGLGGMALIGLTAALALKENPRNLRYVPVAVLVFVAIWIFLSFRARREYLLTIQRRLEARRLDLEDIRVTVQDAATVRLLERVASGPHPRQAAYALGLLAEVPGYDLRPELRALADSPAPEVRAKVYELAGAIRFDELRERALAEVRRAGPASDGLLRPAVAYALAVSSDARRLAPELLDHSNPKVGEATLEWLGAQPEAAAELVTYDWLEAAAHDGRPERRALAAFAIGVRGDQGTEALHRLLADPDPAVVEAACGATGKLRNRAYVHVLIEHLAGSRVRGPAIQALAAFGNSIIGTLSDVLEEGAAPLAIRRQIPRVLRLVPDQRSVDVLMKSISQPNLALRSAVLRALNRLRESAPNLHYGEEAVTQQIMNEARYYYQLHAILAPFQNHPGRRPAVSLLVRTIEERLRQTLERMFRLLGLRYPPRQIYAAYLAVHQRRTAEYAAAIDFLDNILDRQLRRVLLPLFDSTGHTTEIGLDLFGVHYDDPQSAVRELIRSGDSWLAACAMAAAAELGLRDLAPDIRSVAEQAGAEVSLVAQSAVAALA